MARLGQLERQVMESLWRLRAEAPATTFTAREVAAALPSHAYTTVLTVLDRLTRKGIVERIRDGRTHHYRPTGTRESHIAELMHEALAATHDRAAALVHFAEMVPAEEAELLRSVLPRIEPAPEQHRRGAERREQ